MRDQEVSYARVILAVLMADVGVSLSAVFVRFSGAPSLTLAMLRMAFSCLIFLPAACFRRRGELKAMKPGAIALACLGGIALGAHFFTYFDSIKHTSLASGLILVNTEVFFVAAALLLFFKERMNALGVAGVVMAFAGGVIVARGDMGLGPDALYGNAMAVASAMCLAVYTLIGRRARRDGASATVYAFIVYASAALALCVAMLASGAALAGIQGRDILAALGLAVFCTALGHSVFIWALKHISATFISVSRLTEPVLASLWGFLLFHEVPYATQIIGGAVVIAGIVLYIVAGKGRERSPRARGAQPHAIEERKTNA